MAACRTDNKIRADWLSTIAQDIADQCADGKQVVVLGAIARGRQTLGFGSRRLELDEKQAAAACGQITLCAEWSKAFQFESGKALHPAQILLTLDDSENRRRYLNARNTFNTLLAQPKIIPVVNENDTVATDERRVGDNDRLVARVAQIISADLLILLSDVTGLFNADPSTNPDMAMIPVVEEMTPEIEAMAGGVGSSVGSGGMQTKIEAAKIAVAAGCHMIISRGMEPHPVRSLNKSGEGTWFKAKAIPQSARKHWIAGALRSRGSYVIDDRAAAALNEGKSLLPAGVREVKGNFGGGDAVAIETLSGTRVAKGFSEYSSVDALKIIGARSVDIENILGFKYRDTLIHRDDMVLEKSNGTRNSN